MIEALQSIVDWFTSGIYQFFTEFTAYLISFLTVAYLKLSVEALSFSWNVASQILNDLQFSAFLAGLYSGFDSQTKDLLLWLRVPDFASTVTTAYVTRYVMKFIPFA